ncbi:MAG: 23S rRNA (uracil(1939)-C(5))-methyltransferase RlmD [Solobacterium sp.]|nr:23S rRNA (uracil(1939)-C(5))-methyltransferase RlmD [Solobacterium sp.]
MSKIEFVKMGINGEGIGYLNGKPVFCMSVLPGETAEVTVTEENDRYIRAEKNKIISFSEDRIRSCCPYDRKCGGCSLITMKYEAQLVWKKKLLEEALWKYGHVSRKLIRNMHESPRQTAYRTACKLPVSEYGGKLVTGMYQPGTNHFAAIDSCPMHTEELEEVRKQVLEILNRYGLKSFRNGYGIRYLVLRGIRGHFQCALITGRDRLPEGLGESIGKIAGMESVVQSVNTRKKGAGIFGTDPKVLYGSEGITAEVHGISLMLSADSFFQLNVEQAEKLYEMAVSKIDPCNTVAEAYCGVGAMSLLARDKARHVVGIESVGSAVANAGANASANRVPNARFICADAAEGLKKVCSEYQVDTLLADPPRSGMDDAMIEAVLNSEIHKIIYVSCNPATLGKNIKALKQEFDVRTVIPYDMFPNTPLIEAVAVLERRGKPKEKK